MTKSKLAQNQQRSMCVKKKVPLTSPTRGMPMFFSASRGFAWCGFRLAVVLRSVVSRLRLVFLHTHTRTDAYTEAPGRIGCRRTYVDDARLKYQGNKIGLGQICARCSSSIPFFDGVLYVAVRLRLYIISSSFLYTTTSAGCQSDDDGGASIVFGSYIAVDSTQRSIDR